ncbi:MAG: acyl-CoA dehydrogenase family protein [Candidatus Limnocylindria bacterium]
MREAEPIAEAARIADGLLFPRALETDRSDIVPKESLDALASAGLYGVVGPKEAGGLDADFHTFLRVVETLAGGCLSTAFIWIQHHGVLRAAATSSTPGLRERWLGPLCRGEVRAGIALAGLLAGPARVAARRTDRGWTFTGTAPWVTGWGRIDVIQVAGRDEGDNVVFGLIEARPSPAVEIDHPLDLVALRSTVTSAVHFRDLRLPDDRVTGIQPLAERQQQDHATLRVHGALALGVAARCIRMLGEVRLRDELEALRSRMETAAPDEVPKAKAAASELAHRAAGALVVATGSRSLLATEHAQRLAREALFLLVFGSRPAIKGELLRLLAGREASAETR